MPTLQTQCEYLYVFDVFAVGEPRDELGSLRVLLRQRPLHMFTHHLGFMRSTRYQGLYDGGILRCIPQGHGDIAQPTCVSDAADGRALGFFQELHFAPGKQLP